MKIYPLWILQEKCSDILAAQLAHLASVMLIAMSMPYIKRFSVDHKELESHLFRVTRDRTPNLNDSFCDFTFHNFT